MNDKSAKQFEAIKKALAPYMKPDFTYGPLNGFILVAICAAGAAIQFAAYGGPAHRSVALVVASLVACGGLMFHSRWEKAIALSVVFWVVMYFIPFPSEQSIVIPTIFFIAALFISPSVQVAKQWEKAVVLRLGRFKHLKGPGIFFLLPVADKVAEFVDQRVRVSDFSAETTLTRDTVPVNVDAIAFWLIWDAEKSVLEVASYMDAVILSAQTGLREAIGRHELSELLSERDKIGKEIQAILDEKTNPWGITTQAVEIRDITIPKGLEDAMSRQAQAERERQSRIILGTAETEIAEKFEKASERYKDNPVALHLRAMNMIFEGLKTKGSMIIVPSSAVETMGLGSLGGLTALGIPRHVAAKEEVVEEEPEKASLPKPKAKKKKKE